MTMREALKTGHRLGNHKGNVNVGEQPVDATLAYYAWHYEKHGLTEWLCKKLSLAESETVI